jgi:hypothetical protein
VPPEVEWFANISNLHSRRAYKNAIRFTGIVRPRDPRAHHRPAR